MKLIIKSFSDHPKTSSTSPGTCQVPVVYQKKIQGILLQGEKSEIPNRVGWWLLARAFLLANLSPLLKPDSMFFHEILEIGSLEPDFFCRPGYVPVIRGQSIEKEIFLHFTNRLLPDLFFDFFEFLVGGWYVLDKLSEIIRKGKLLQAYVLFVTKDGRSFNGIPQLPDIPRPVVLGQLIHRSRIETADILPQAAIELLQEMVGNG